MKKPVLLIVNDDGYNAPGIKELYDAVKDIGEVYVVAPATEQSGKALGFTFTHPLEVLPAEGFETPAWKVSGTPADCVKIALSVLNITPDLILSGINHGSNAGRNAYYSGTVGGVIEGALRGIPGIAFSFEHMCNQSFHDMKMFIPPIIEHTLQHTLPTHTFFNVTFPHHPHSEIKGVRIATQGMSYVLENPSKDETGKYMLGGKWSHFDEHEESDISLLRQGFITMAPISMKTWTDHETFSRHKELITGLDLGVAQTEAP